MERPAPTLPANPRPATPILTGVPLSLAFVVRIVRLFSIFASYSSHQAAALPRMVAMTFWTDLDMVWQDMGTGYDLVKKGEGTRAMRARGTFAVAAAIVSEVAVMACSVPAAPPSFPARRTRP